MPQNIAAHSFRFQDMTFFRICERFRFKTLTLKKITLFWVFQVFLKDWKITFEVEKPNQFFSRVKPIFVISSANF